jgi:hypothetical protein
LSAAENPDFHTSQGGVWKGEEVGAIPLHTTTLYRGVGCGVEVLGTKAKVWSVEPATGIPTQDRHRRHHDHRAPKSRIVATRISQDEDRELQLYLAATGESLSDLVRRSIFERTGRFFDLG